ncbi:MAG: hypothetical protein PHU21_12395, partial [Elusimicrobia bacterium]|nr:hypothetical protein [Elusimicrobiota bacterium]
MKTRWRRLLWALALAPGLAGCSTEPVASEFGDAAPARPRPVQKRALNCRDEGSIRDFKDFLLARVTPDPFEVERWAFCLCADAAREAGVNAVRPAPAQFGLAAPTYDVHRRDESLAQIRDWFKGTLPISAAQAAKLTDCVYGKE